MLRLRQFVVLLLVCCGVQGFAQSKYSVDFIYDWGQALDLAKEENKLIFLNACTDWCVPCKTMDKHVFTSGRVGRFYNQHFINVKMNMEKGHGPALAVRYDVIAFPTFLFLTPDGNLIHRYAGYRSPDELIQLGEDALDPARQLAAMDNRYAEGDRHPDFMYEYLMAKYNAMDGSHVAIVDEYFDTQEDWGTDRNVALIYELVRSVDDPKFEYLLKNKDRFIQVIDEEKVNDLIQALVFEKLFKAMPPPTLEDAHTLFHIISPKQADELFSNYKVNRHLNNGDYTSFALASIEHMDSYTIDDPELLNNIAWKFYEHVEDPELLKHALSWAKKSAKIRPDYYNQDTIAALYFKLNKKNQAKKYALEAIKIAQSEQIDYSETEELLKKIEDL